MGTININGSTIIGNITIGNGGVFNGGNQNRVSGDGVRAEEQRPLSEPFDRVDVSAFGKVEITAGQEQDQLTLSGDSNILEHVETRIEDGMCLASDYLTDERAEGEPRR